MTTTTAIDQLSDVALVQTALGIRKAERAYAILDECGGLRGIARGSLSETVATADVRRLAAVVELGRRAVEAQAKPANWRLDCRNAVEAWARPRLATLDTEQLWVLSLDGRHGLRAATMVASGGIHGLHVTPRDVLRAAIKESASAFILTHNHPSGDPAPSEEDVEFTRAVLRACDAVGLVMLDHVIVARGRSSSMVDSGIVERLTAENKHGR